MQKVSYGSKAKIWQFLGCELLTIGLGFLSGLLSGSMNGYDGINMPSFSPPSQIFAPVWTIMFFLMGWSLFLTISHPKTVLQKASLILWCVQFALALIWPFIFFNVDKTVAFVINCFLTATVIALITLNFAVNKTSAWLLVPYVLWLIFASLQTLAIIILNA